MHGQLSFDYVAGFLLLVIGVAIGALFMIQNLGGGDRLPSVAQQVQQSDYPVCGDYATGDTVSRTDLHRIVYGRYIDNCGDGRNNVTLGFTLTDEALRRFATRFGITTDGTPRIRYRADCDQNPRFEGVTVGADRQDVLFPETTDVMIETTGNGVRICPRS